MIYAISDIHGCLDALNEALQLVDLSGDNKLILLGDYIHGGQDNYGTLDRIMDLERRYGTDKIIVLSGNHEDMACDGRWPIGETGRSDSRGADDQNDKYISWIRNLRRYYVEGSTIFVHAGIDEEAGDLWKWGTDEYTMTEKYPAQTGKFVCGDEDMKIVAGHIGTAAIAEDPSFHDIYFDGESHYYIDGTVLETGVIPVLKVDVENQKYYRVTDSGDLLIRPYDKKT